MQYNGCSWKGGRLKLEKAKEDYLARLKREWEEDAQSEEVNLNVDEDESLHATQKPKTDYDIDKLQLKLFFPKLRKVVQLNIEVYAFSLFIFVGPMNPAHCFSYGIVVLLSYLF